MSKNVIVKKYYATKIGESIKKIISPLIKDSIISDLVKSWSEFMPQWALELTPTKYTKQTKVLYISSSNNIDILSIQYKSEELRNLINIHLGYIAVLNVKVNLLR